MCACMEAWFGDLVVVVVVVVVVGCVVAGNASMGAPSQFVATLSIFHEKCCLDGVAMHDINGKQGARAVT
jgi:hypothetical protein